MLAFDPTDQPDAQARDDIVSAMPTGLIFSDRFLGHDTGLGHPERPARLQAIVAALKQAGVWGQLTYRHGNRRRETCRNA
jgi:hypothetical protein